MKCEQVKKLKPFDQFIYWMKERHSIYLKKEKGEPKPWTDDVIFQNFYFTNPYRENDKVTKWFRDNIRDPLKMDSRVFMATIIFRWFNKIPTGEFLLGLNVGKKLTDSPLCVWKEKTVSNKLVKLWDNGKNPVFTGAFMIKAGDGPRGSKIPTVCSCINDIWKKRKQFIDTKWESMESLWKELKNCRGLGGFMSYEIVCDLRYTHVLEGSKDINTWCNMGPGAKRGMNRLESRDLKDSISPALWNDLSRALLPATRKRLKSSQSLLNHQLMMPLIEMREIEHSLCEYDKYCRALAGNTSNMKRRYNGVS